MSEEWHVAGRIVLTQYSEKDHGYIATVPSLPGCSAWGHSEQDAAEGAIEAIDAWIQACVAAGNPVPAEDADA